MNVSVLKPDELPCPTCKRKSLTYGLQFKMDPALIEFGGVSAIAVGVQQLPAIWCTANGCHFVQWGERHGEFVVFNGGPQ